MKLDPTNTGRARRGRLALLVATMALMLGVPAMASAGTVPSPPSGTPAAQASLASPQGYLAVPVNLIGTRSGSTPTSFADLSSDELASRIRQQVDPWISAVSHGASSGPTVTAVNDVTVTPLEQLCSSNWQQEIIEDAEDWLEFNGPDPSLYQGVFYYISLDVPCPDFETFSHGGGTLIDSGFDQGTLTHAVGHFLGLQDSYSRTCTSASGVPVTLSDFIGGSCQTHAFGDVYNAMGTFDPVPMSYSSRQLEQLGWNTGRVERISTGTPTVTKFLTPMESSTPGTDALRVSDGVTLWLEYRTPTGVDVPAQGSPLGGGLLVRMENSIFTDLLNMTPTTSTGPFEHPEMRVGQTWVNPRGNLSFTLNSASLLGASVTITQRTRLVPDLVGLKSTAARTAITGAGFVVGTTSSVFDCQNIGKVISQNPLRGTPLLPGRVVNFTFGVAPVRGCGSGPQQ